MCFGPVGTGPPFTVREEALSGGERSANSGCARSSLLGWRRQRDRITSLSYCELHLLQRILFVLSGCTVYVPQTGHS